ncbi:MAG: hypothetical protein K2I00_01940 [Ruminococcus sp.]|nr:hypothetical protein [Ruminococcus sp.]
MNVQKALLARGIHSDVLMVGDQDGLYCKSETGNVYSIQSSISFENKKKNIVRYLKTRIPMIFTWPVSSYRRVNQYRRAIEKLNRRQKYDAIIGTMFPPDVCVSCSSFEHFFMYELDSLINNPISKEGIKKYFKFRLIKTERGLYNRAELIIHLNNNKRFYSKKEYQLYADKFVYADIPNLVEESTDVQQNVSDGEVYRKYVQDDELLMVYSGHLSKDHRSPSELIELIKLISDQAKVKCLFFSRGDCEDELRKAEVETNDVIRRMGYVSQEELKQFTDRADFLLDIGNQLTGEDYSLPSKVISYMATGKPIIHINGVNDSAIQYLEKYGMALNVVSEMSATEKKQAVWDFIEKTRGKRLPFADIAKKFPQNTPEYTADLIIRQIEKRKAVLAENGS